MSTNSDTSINAPARRAGQRPRTLAGVERAAELLAPMPLVALDGSSPVGLLDSEAARAHTLIEAATNLYGGLAVRVADRLSRRWLVLVPAGVVVVDSMTLAEPVLFVRRHVRGLRPSEPAANIPDDVLDLRLGATLGNVLIDLDGTAEMVRANRGGRGGVTVKTTRLLVAVTQRAAFLAMASARRVRVEVTEGNS